jgi:WD40 repeat protein
MRADYAAFVTAALFDGDGRGVFALGDGSVRFEGGETQLAHDGAILCAAMHPKGLGVLTGGDDGRVALTTPEGSQTFAELKGRWIDALAASPANGLVAFGAGRELHVRDVADPAFARMFVHERSVAGIDFEAKGRRIAVATYGGALLWYARIADQRPVRLNWAGSHIACRFSPDGRFLMSSMQENQLHGWRLSDAKDMRMGGYPAKVKSLEFLSGGKWLATAGAPGVILWPFQGNNGPMGKNALEIGVDETSMVTCVAATADSDILAVGVSNGRVWVCDVEKETQAELRSAAGAPISALAVSADGQRVAWGDEAGGAGVEAVVLPEAVR